MGGGMRVDERRGIANRVVAARALAGGSREHGERVQKQRIEGGRGCGAAVQSHSALIFRCRRPAADGTDAHGGSLAPPVRRGQGRRGAAPLSRRFLSLPRAVRCTGPNGGALADSVWWMIRNCCCVLFSSTLLGKWAKEHDKKFGSLHSLHLIKRNVTIC
jgi:hypothetical protein